MLGKNYDGNIARATTLSPTEMSLKPVDPTFGKDLFRDKIEKLKILRDVCQDIPGVTIPKIISDFGNEVIVERAKGMNITETSGLSRGDDIDFLNISTENKLMGAVRYMQVISALDNAMRPCIDHKSDSVFLMPSGKITIVDGGIMDLEKRYKPMEKELNASNQTFLRTLRSFFDRENSQFRDTLAPAGFVQIINQMEELCDGEVGPDKAIAEIQKYMQDPTPIEKQAPMYIGGVETNVWQEGMTRLQYDLAVADAWRKWEISRLDRK